MWYNLEDGPFLTYGDAASVKDVPLFLLTHYSRTSRQVCWSESLRCRVLVRLMFLALSERLHHQHVSTLSYITGTDVQISWLALVKWTEALNRFQALDHGRERLYTRCTPIKHVARPKSHIGFHNDGALRRKIKSRKLLFNTEVILWNGIAVCEIRQIPWLCLDFVYVYVQKFTYPCSRMMKLIRRLTRQVFM